MQSKLKKSILWCGEKLDLFDETQLSQDLPIKGTEDLNVTVIKKIPQEDVDFLNSLSAEDMDLAFGADTFTKANKLVNIKDTADTIEQPRSSNIICSDYNQLSSNKRFLPVDEQSRFDNQKEGAKKFVTYGNFKRFQRHCFKEYEVKIRNGFYTGFMTSILCETCESLLGCHPSPYKRVCWVTNTRCIYCKGKFEPVTFEDLKYLRNQHDTYKQKKYFINQKHGVKGSITQKLLTSHGKDLSAPFEHCWISNDDQD